MVVGAGPAGLLLASKLGSDFRVSVIERRALGTTAKYWVTNEHRLRSHGLSSCVRHRASRVTAGSLLGSQAETPGDFVVVDEVRLLRELAERCNSLDIEILEHCELLSLGWSNGGVDAVTNKGRLSTRLLIDASGGASPIASTFNLHRLSGFFTVYGAHLQGINLTTEDIVGAHHLRLAKPVPIFELIPTGPASAFCVVFTASARVRPREEMKALYQSHLNNNPFFTPLNTSHELAEKMGAIPIGRLRRRRLPGIVPFGEASLIQAPLLGAAFNDALEYVDSYCAAIRSSMTQNEKQWVDVPPLLPTRKLLNDRLQLLLAKRILESGAEEFDALVRFLDAIGEEACYRLICSQLQLKDLWRIGLAMPNLVDRHEILRNRRRDPQETR